MLIEVVGVVDGGAWVCTCWGQLLHDWHVRTEAAAGHKLLVRRWLPHHSSVQRPGSGHSVWWCAVSCVCEALALAQRKTFTLAVTWASTWLKVRLTVFPSTYNNVHTQFVFITCWNITLNFTHLLETYTNLNHNHYLHNHNLKLNLTLQKPSHHFKFKLNDLHGGNQWGMRSVNTHTHTHDWCISSKIVSSHVEKWKTNTF